MPKLLCTSPISVAISVSLGEVTTTLLFTFTMHRFSREVIINHMRTDTFLLSNFIRRLCHSAGNRVRMSSPMHNCGGSGEPAHK